MSFHPPERVGEIARDSAGGEPVAAVHHDDAAECYLVV
jgi:hypothetical protein